MTLLTLSMPWPTLIIIFPLCICIFSSMASLVRLYLMTSDDEREWIKVFFIPAPPGITWLFAAAAAFMIMSPAPALQRLLAVLFSLFLFKMTLSDAITGFLPREMTVSCLIAGLVSALTVPAFWEHFFSAVTALAVFAVWRYASFKMHGRECLGLGDVWLAGAVSAWLGGPEGLSALLAGVIFLCSGSCWFAASVKGDRWGPGCAQARSL